MSETDRTDGEFAELVEDFLGAEFDLHPTAASGRGLVEYDPVLDDLSAEAFAARDEHAVRWLTRFEAIEDGLSPDERIDRDLALSVLRGRTILADWEAWRRDPITYTEPILSGLFGLFLHRLRPERELVDAAVARLERAPVALEQGMANLDPALAHPLIVDRGAAAARAGVRYLRELLPADVAPGPERDRLAAAGDRAAGALEGWIRFLEAFRARASGTWRLGEERYTRLLQEREALGDDARSLRERGRTEYARVDAEMRDLSHRKLGTEDWQRVLERAKADRPLTEEAMRAAYEDWTGRAREFLATTGLVTLPEGERCVVEPSPVFQRPVIGVASYSSPPPFSDSMLGHFFVPFAPDGTPPDEVARRLGGNSFANIPTISVHETYPGHHWHLVTRKLNPRPMRRTFSTPYFTEGWALYAERVVRERGFFTEPLHELYHMRGTIFRAARIVVDTSLHIGEMTEDEAIAFMVENASLPEPTARAEVGRYCWWPTQASAYLTGCLEILRIRDRYLERRGFADVAPADVPIEVLRDFHDSLALTGSLPLGLAERALLGFDS